MLYGSGVCHFLYAGVGYTYSDRISRIKSRQFYIRSRSVVKREQGTGDGERQEETVSYPDESTEEKEAGYIPPRQSELAVPDMQGKPMDGILFYWKTGIIM